MREGKIAINGAVYNIECKLMCTMIDGKVCQVITDTSASSNCTVCVAKPFKMNWLQAVRAREGNVASQNRCPESDVRR